MEKGEGKVDMRMKVGGMSREGREREREGDAREK